LVNHFISFLRKNRIEYDYHLILGFRMKFGLDKILVHSVAQTIIKDYVKHLSRGKL